MFTTSNLWVNRVPENCQICRIVQYKIAWSDRKSQCISLFGLIKVVECSKSEGEISKRLGQLVGQLFYPEEKQNRSTVGC